MHRSKVLRVDGKAVTVADGDQPWPDRWDFACFHCCHPFDGVPFGVPITYDSNRKRYRCVGRYCSANCAKAALLERGWSMGPRGMYFSSMLRTHFGVGWLDQIVPALPRERLAMFGGDLTIEQFREMSTTVVNRRLPPGMIAHVEHIEEYNVNEQREKQDEQRRAAQNLLVSIGNHQPAPIRVERKKPLLSRYRTLDTFARGRRV